MYNPGSSGLEFFRILVSPLKCGTPTFSPNGGSVEEGGSVTITSTDATSIKYAWTAEDVDTPDSWTTETATDNAITVTVPDAVDNTPRLHAYGIKTGYTDGDAAYKNFTITGADNTAPTLTNQSIAANATEVATAGNITLTFDENVQVADASGVTLTGGAATISSVTAEDNVVTIAYTGLAYNTAYTLAVANGAITDIATAHNAYAGTSFSFTTAKEAMPNPTISGDGYFVGSQTVTITSDVDGATITYSLDGETYSAYTEPIVLTATKTVYAKATHANYSGEGTANKAMYLVSAPIGQEDVTDDTEWGFGDGLNPGENVTNGEIPLTELLSTVSGYAEKEGATQITFIKPQRYDKGGYVQAHGFIINTSVPGKLSINFTNGNGDLRYLMVNGVKKGQISSSGANVNANDIEIPAGTIVVYGHNVPTNAPNNLRYKKITFTPATETVTVSSAEYATFAPVNTVAVPADVTAYIVSETSASSVTLDEVTVIPAGTPVIVYKEGAADTEVTFTATDADASDVSGNRLQVSASSVTADGTQYVLAQVEGVVGFHKVIAGTTIAAGKAYLVSPAGANFLRFDFDDETTGITNNNREDITNNGEYFNLAGQRVAQPAKGLYIVNGKKVVIR
ncbi:MAG: Ig-like domain-containing protein [Prevotella sp.]|nr:Ig-like domain-containing protein [Prevotella sp.]